MVGRSEPAQDAGQSLCCRRDEPCLLLQTWVALGIPLCPQEHSFAFRMHSFPPPPIQTTKQHRLDKVRELRWETGGAVIPAHLQRKLSAKEAEFFASYDKLLSEYMGHYPLLDLTGSTLVRTESLWNARPGWGSKCLISNASFLDSTHPPTYTFPHPQNKTQPPKEMCIEVRVLQDCGEIMTDQGPVNLEKGTNHFLRRTDVEGLIRQGMLQHVAPPPAQGSA